MALLLLVREWAALGSEDDGPLSRLCKAPAARLGLGLAAGGALALTVGAARPSGAARGLAEVGVGIALLGVGVLLALTVLLFLQARQY